MSESFELGQPEHFTAGAIGEPGARTFFLQAAEGGVLVSIKCEKEQVGVLAEYLSGILEDLPALGEHGTVAGDLVLPVTAEWAAGSIGVAYDEDADRVVLVIEELVGDDVDDDAATFRVRLRRDQVDAFIRLSRQLVEAGRPTCPLCGQPMDPDGHACPRSNGHRNRR